MERDCVDCDRPIGIEEDPTDGRCPECDVEYLSRLAEGSPKRRKTAKEDEGE